MHAAKTYRFDFLKYRYVIAFVSFAIVVASVGKYFYNEKTRGSAFTYSVDFTGGTQIQLQFDKPVSASAVRIMLEQQGLQGITTREFSDKEILVRVREYSNDAQGLALRIRDLVSAEFKDTQVKIVQSESVGPGIGAELRRNFVYATSIALIVLLLYIAITFWSYSYAVGAVVALCHDAFVMLALYLFLDRDISIHVISAILAVLGYSINDTIVIFSRIRENKAKMAGVALGDIINLSINETLRRTLLTSLSTTLAVGSMLVVGGEALRDFSLTLLVGIVFGTYSSIFIASPVMLALHKDTKNS